jgi:hypothetical protein
MKSYKDFNDVNEFRKYYHLDNQLVIEAKNDKDFDDPEKVINKDKLEVHYAEFNKKDCKNIFKHIIVFTNDSDSKNNKTLKNIEDAIESLKKSKCDIIPKLHVFVAANVISDDQSEDITIEDDKDKFVVDDESPYIIASKRADGTRPIKAWVADDFEDYLHDEYPTTEWTWADRIVYDYILMLQDIDAYNERETKKASEKRKSIEDRIAQLETELKKLKEDIK